MALADLTGFDVRPTPLLSRLFRKAADAFAAYRTERARRLALGELLHMPDHRLRDLGIDRGEIARAIAVRHWPTRK